MNGRVAWIMIAPVKGLGLVSLDEVPLTHEGAAGNRRFHLIDDRGRMVNGKRLGRLVQVRPDYDDAERRLVLRFPDGTEAAGTVELGEPVESEFFGQRRPGRFVEGPWSEALSAYAGAGLRLVELSHTGAAVDRGRRGAMSLLSTAAAAAHGLDPRRFRMLFGVEGIAAHAEDDWVGYRVRVGDAVVRPLAQTGRCLITSQDPDTGLRGDVDVLELLRHTRPPDTEEPLAFGVHGMVVESGTVRLGDPVEPFVDR